MQAKDRIIVALDTQDTRKAREWVSTLVGNVGGFKIGLEYMTSLLSRMMTLNPDEANKEFEEARDLFNSIGTDLFWDGKWHDIPNTLKGSAKSISLISPRYFNVHASSGIAAMRAAASEKGDSKMLVVTVLTSLDEEDAFLVYGAPSKATVVKFARDAKLAGADGLICSPQEITVIRQRPELDDLILVTPGVRPAWAVVGDQRRVMTPSEAIKAGATALVIGRPITQPPSEVGTSLDAVERITQEIANLA